MVKLFKKMFDLVKLVKKNYVGFYVNQIQIRVILKNFPKFKLRVEMKSVRLKKPKRARENLRRPKV